jgi:outer membrane protein assembly factor BamB
MSAGRQIHNQRHQGRLPVLAFLCLAFCCEAADWPQFRGANHDGVSTDRITTQWSGSVTNPLWLVPVTNCLGSLAVSGGRVFTQTVRPNGGTSKEVCVALSATNGVELWAVTLDTASYSGGVGFDDGPRTTPAVDGGSVIVLSSYLKLCRLNATNGAVVWQQDLRTVYGGDVISWQNAASPLVEGGLIFLNANCANSNLMALRISDGSPAWRSQSAPMTHSTPVLATILGVRQVIFATQIGLVSLEAATGNLLWRFPYPFSYFTSLGASPVVWQDMVFVCGARAYSMGSVVMQASLTNNTWTTRQLWWTNNPSAHWMTPVCSQGFLYGQFGVLQFDSPTAQLKCIDLRLHRVSAFPGHSKLQRPHQQMLERSGGGRWKSLCSQHRLRGRVRFLGPRPEAGPAATRGCRQTRTDHPHRHWRARGLEPLERHGSPDSRQPRAGLNSVEPVDQSSRADQRRGAHWRCGFRGAATRFL